MNAILAIALLAILALAGCFATGGQGIWAIPLVVVAAGCGRLLARGLSGRRYAVSDVPHSDKRGA
jgi:hypothetical protein